MKQRIEYISIINAIAIIAVMIGHLDVTGVNQDPNTPIANVIEKFGSFQMPLFMCVWIPLYYDFWIQKNIC